MTKDEVESLPAGTLVQFSPPLAHAFDASSRYEKFILILGGGVYLTTSGIRELRGYSLFISYLFERRIARIV